MSSSGLFPRSTTASSSKSSANRLISLTAIDFNSYFKPETELKLSFNQYKITNPLLDPEHNESYRRIKKLGKLGLTCFQIYALILALQSI